MADINEGMDERVLRGWNADGRQETIRLATYRGVYVYLITIVYQMTILGTLFFIALSYNIHLLLHPT